MAIVKLERLISTSEFTLGKFDFQGIRYYTCEDAIRLKKIPKITCIPEGKYQVVITFSNRFKRKMPLLLDVPNFTGIRIHSGNYANDTEGCILIGHRLLTNGVADSREAYDEFFRHLKKLLETEEVWLDIHNPKQLLKATPESSKAADDMEAGPSSTSLRFS